MTKYFAIVKFVSKSSSNSWQCQLYQSYYFQDTAAAACLCLPVAGIEAARPASNVSSQSRCLHRLLNICPRASVHGDACPWKAQVAKSYVDQQLSLELVWHLEGRLAGNMPEVVKNFWGAGRSQLGLEWVVSRPWLILQLAKARQNKASFWSPPPPTLSSVCAIENQAAGFLQIPPFQASNPASLDKKLGPAGWKWKL